MPFELKIPPPWRSQGWSAIASGSSRRTSRSFTRRLRGGSSCGAENSSTVSPIQDECPTKLLTGFGRT